MPPLPPLPPSANPTQATPVLSSIVHSRCSKEFPKEARRTDFEPAPSRGRANAKKMFHTKEQYLKVTPGCLGNRPRVWEAIVDWWLDPDRRAFGKACSERRALMGGGSHRQGNLGPFAYKKKLEEKEGREFRVLESWSCGRTKPDGSYCNPHVGPKMEEYSKVSIERNGPEFNPIPDPIDPRAIVIAGGCKKHVRHVILNSSVEPSTSISQSGSPSIRPRSQPATALITQLEAKVNQLEEEKQGWENRMDELSRKMVEREANEVALRNLVQTLLTNAAPGVTIPEAVLAALRGPETMGSADSNQVFGGCYYSYTELGHPA